MKPNKHPKMDPKLVAKNELDHIVSKYKVKRADAKAAQKLVGPGRVKVYALLRTWGYVINTKK